MNLEPYKARLAAATPVTEWTFHKVVTDDDYSVTVKTGDDWAFLFNVPTDIAELVAEVERLQAVIDGVREISKKRNVMVYDCANENMAYEGAMESVRDVIDGAGQ